MSYHQLFATLVLIAALASYINDRFLNLPKTIALTIISITIALMVTLSSSLPHHYAGPVYTLIKSVDFKATVLDVMLGYLLFASGLHVNSIDLRREIIPVIYLASIGVVIATFLTGYMLFYFAKLFHMQFNLGECLIFGALISPTDAIAVLGAFKALKNPPLRLKTLITGEGLFNDAAAILMLVILSQVVYDKVHLTFGEILQRLIRETGGGILWGILIGMLASWFLKRARSPEVATLISIAAASCGYVLANAMHISGVITMVVAGLIIGGYSKKDRFSTTTTLVLNNFWELIDEILNAFLFVLIGLAMLNIDIDHAAIILGLVCILIVFIARLLSIWLPDFIFAAVLRRKPNFSQSTLLAWGGIRGGLSIALALSIDDFPDNMVAITYVVVLSSILIQGGSFKWAIAKFTPKAHNNHNKLPSVPK